MWDSVYTSISNALTVFIFLDLAHMPAGLNYKLRSKSDLNPGPFSLESNFFQLSSTDYYYYFLNLTKTKSIT